jgi:predicted nucleotidyltransferase
MGSVSDASAHLRALAKRLTDAYRAGGARAALLVGSAGRGDADEYSDLDLLLYYNELPPEEALAEVRREVGADRFSGRGDEAGYGERYYLDGIQCQVAHVTIESVEGEIARLVVRLELDAELAQDHERSPRGQGATRRRLDRALAADCRLHRRASACADRGALEVLSLVDFQERLRARDTTLWRYDVLVRSAYDVVGVLAALNGLYFSTLEFKRSGDFLARLGLAPPNLAARLEALFELDERASTAELERLVEETGTLVSERFPDLDLSLEWGGMPTPPGSRESPWR